jgi:hypothetical protein
MSEKREPPRCLFTMTLLDILVAAAERHKEKELRQVIREVSGRGMRRGEVLDYAREHLHPDAMKHFETVLASMRKAS